MSQWKMMTIGDDAGTYRIKIRTAGTVPEDFGKLVQCLAHNPHPVGGWYIYNAECPDEVAFQRLRDALAARCVAEYTKLHDAYYRLKELSFSEYVAPRM